MGGRALRLLGLIARKTHALHASFLRIWADVGGLLEAEGPHTVVTRKFLIECNTGVQQGQEIYSA